MKVSKYLVSTTMGRALMDPQAETYVKVSAYSFLEKASKDLKPGDLVLFAKPFATTVLNDVIPHLGKSPRYAKARDIIYETNTEGEHIPLLRGMLIKGLAKRGIISGQSLEDKIFKERGDDFSEGEYERMVDALYEDLRVGERHYRSRSAIRNWLDGTVIAPRIGEWFLLSDVLSKKVNSDLEIFQQGSDNPTSIYFNYRLYVTIHQGVMRFLRQAKGLPPEKEYIEAEARISLSPEYQIVFNHFMQEINANYALARVTSTRPISKEHENSLKLGTHASQSIVNSKKIEMPRKNIQEIWTEMYVLGKYLEAASEEFPVEPVTSPVGDEIWFRNRADRYGTSSTILSFWLEHFQEPLDPLAKYIKDESPARFFLHDNKKSYPDEIFARKSMDILLSGEMDAFLNFSHGTLMKLLEAYFRVRTVIPNSIYECLKEDYENLLAAIPNRLYTGLGINTHLMRIKNIGKDRNRQRELDRKIKKIEQRYNIRINQYTSSLSTPIFLSDRSAMDNHESDSNGREKVLAPREFLDMIKNDSERLKSFIEMRRREGAIGFLTRKQTKDILQQHYCIEVLNLRKQDFYFERLNIIKE